jgi:exonuclease III
VRGLNGATRRASVCNLISSSGAFVVCLQETKISRWNDFLLKETLGQALASQIVCLPASRTAGGVLIAASDRLFSLNHLYTTEHTITANICSLADNTNWSITGVYDPQSDEDKVNFLAEFASIKLLTNHAWIALGDFNLICSASDKNMGRINHRMIQRFNRTLDDLQLIELFTQWETFHLEQCP